MLHRIALLVGVAVLGLASLASAQVEVRGVVTHVDPVTRTIYLTDGRMVRVEPGTMVVVNGKTVAFESLRPGMGFVLSQAPGQTTTVTTVTQQVQPAVPATVVPLPAVSAPVAVALPAPSPVTVTGTIARVDPTTQTVTFQDGRMVRMGAQTQVWQQQPAVTSLQPGAHVTVRDALPVGYLSSAAAPANGQWLLGTVSRVDTTSQHIVLTDGTVVRLAPGATLRVGNEHVAVGQLRPGDEIVMLRPMTVTQLPSATAVPADRYVGSALPYQGSRFEASDVIVIWTPQSR